MEIEYDPAKSAKNARDRGLPFDLVAELEWGRAFAFEDDRFEYGEERMIAFVPMHGRLYVVCYQMRGRIRRIISFRKANRREERIYAQATADR
jgi:uncharacterized DUF497 family protein